MPESARREGVDRRADGTARLARAARVRVFRVFRVSSSREMSTVRARDGTRPRSSTGGGARSTVAAMRDVVEEDLRRASRDNECVYMTKVPAYDDVPALGAAAVVKPAPPPPAALDASGETLFSKIVPESGFKALSKYTELVDAIIREETDVLASASDEARLALTEMELPELLFAASSLLGLVLLALLLKALDELLQKRLSKGIDRVAAGVLAMRRRYSSDGSRRRRGRRASGGSRDDSRTSSTSA